MGRRGPQVSVTHAALDRWPCLIRYSLLQLHQGPPVLPPEALHHCSPVEVAHCTFRIGDLEKEDFAPGRSMEWSRGTTAPHP